MERTILTASAGMILTDGETYGTKIFLAEERDQADFYEISRDEYERIMVEITEGEYAVLAEEIAEKAALVAALAAGEITEAEIREDWRDEIVRRAAAVSASTDAYTREALEAMTNADLEIILAGMGISANMTKANMVTLILAMQGGEAL